MNTGGNGSRVSHALSRGWWHCNTHKDFITVFAHLFEHLATIGLEAGIEEISALLELVCPHEGAHIVCTPPEISVEAFY